MNQISETKLPRKIHQPLKLSNLFLHQNHLDLSSTNLQFRHFKFLQTLSEPINSNLVTFSLLSNFLEEKSFNLLSKINYHGKLRNLGLAQTSLISSKSIDSILKMIKQDGEEKSSLTNLTVYKTSITTDNMIRLLQNIETSNILNLNIGHNAFQHSKYYDIPFNNTFFEFLSNCNLTSLKRLSMTQLDLDGQQLQYLRNLKLPSLQSLDLSETFINDDYLRYWITKQNMPMLKSLRLQQVDLTDVGIEILSKSGLQLEQIYIFNNRKLTSLHLDHLSSMNTSKFVRLDLSANMIYQHSLRKFFQNKSFQNLKHLTFNAIPDAFRLFSFINWTSMKNLQVLQLQQTDLSQSFENIFTDKITFPNLKILRIGGLWFTKGILDRFLDNLKNFGPQLEYTYIMNHQLVLDLNFFNMTGINSTNIPDGMYLQNQNIKLRKMKNDSRWEFLRMIFDSEFFRINFNYTFFGNYQESEPYQLFLFNNQTQIDMVVQKLKEISSFENIEVLNFEDWGHFVLFRRMMFPNLQHYKQQYIKIVTENKTDIVTELYLPYLQAINYLQTNPSTINDSPQYIYYLSKIQMPLLQTLVFQSQDAGFFPMLANALLKKNVNIDNLIISSCELGCQIFGQMFKNVYLPYLFTFQIPSNEVEVSCLKKFVEKHQFIKFLNVADNFLQRGFFEQVIASNQLILKTLNVGYIQLGNQQFAKISVINRQFLTTLEAASASFTSEGIQMLIANVTGYLFPKISQINLQSNYINEKGVIAFLQTGVPFLRQFKVHNVQNPNVINNLLSYPNKLSVITALDANVYGLKQNLDPRSTRHIKQIILKSPNLILEDFRILSKLQFPNLVLLLLMIQNIYDCQILKYLLQIVRTTEVFQIDIKNQKLKGKFLNDKCLQLHNSSDVYATHLKAFAIAWPQELAYIPKFYTYLYSQNQVVTALSLHNSLIGDQVFLQIVTQCNIEHLYEATLSNNLISDVSLGKFFKTPLKKLNMLSLKGNQFTWKSLVNIVNKTFDELQMLDLAENDIGDKGIEYLTEATFPNLMALGIGNIGMTKKGLFELFNLKTPKLFGFFMTNVLFNEFDLIQFFQRIPVQNFPLLSEIETNLKISEKSYQKLIAIILRRFNRPILIKAQVYHLDLINKSEI